MKLTIEKLKAFGADRTFLACAKATLLAKAFAQCERERVDGYIKPLFELYTFTVARDMGGRDLKAGDPITDFKHVWLAPDEQTNPWFEECDKEHRKHGFKGPKGHCPALTAESLLVTAENNLLDYGLSQLELGFERSSLWGEKREKMLDLLLSMACQQPGFKVEIAA